MAKADLTAQRLRELLNYDPETGVFTWLVHRQCIRAGSVAGGGLNSSGYARIRVDGRLYPAHRLAWLYVSGEWPKNEIDHIDRDKENNRIANLRDVPKCENQQNRGLVSTNKTGLVGVYPHHKGFQAMICVSKKLVCLGTYKTKEDASAAYIEAKRKHHPNFARGHSSPPCFNA